MFEKEEAKSVRVYALQSPESKILLHFSYPSAYYQTPEGSGKERHYEEAAIISYVYTLTGPRRPQPSVEPEKTIYKNLRPWKKITLPRYVVASDSGLSGSPVIFWDGKKSLQGEAPWGRPVVGHVVGEPGKWEVEIDPSHLAFVFQQDEKKKLAASKKKLPEVAAESPSPVVEVVVEPAPEPIPELEFVAEEIEFSEPVAVYGTPVENNHVDYTGDAFVVNEEGRYVGDDGFVVPLNFDEFYERYPKYVINWVKKRLNRFTIDDDVEDWTQDLLIHMKFLPERSKHRQSGANGRQNGCQDVIETFNPYQQYGASERRFRNYINFCLANKFNTVQSKRAKNPVCRPGNVSFDVPELNKQEERSAGGDEFVHANSSYLTQASEKKQKQHDDALFTGQFKRYVQKEDPSVFPAIEALEATGPLGEAAEYMGVTEQEFARYRARLKQLGDCFVKNSAPPKQRKPYKKRTTAI